MNSDNSPANSTPVGPPPTITKFVYDFLFSLETEEASFNDEIIFF